MEAGVRRLLKPPYGDWEKNKKNLKQKKNQKNTKKNKKTTTNKIKREETPDMS